MNLPTKTQADAEATARIAELERRCEMLETVINELPVTVWVKDAEGRYLVANKLHCQIVDRPREDFIGNTSFDLFPLADALRFAERDRKMMESGFAMENEDEHNNADAHGREFWMASRRAPLTLPSGERIILNVGREITERRNAEVKQKALHEELEQAHTKINTELSVACAMQVAILPAGFPVTRGCEGAARMRAATTMGGDFYDFIPLPDGKIGLVIADVSGKGVPAAFFMAVTRTTLRHLAASTSGPGQCLQLTNDVLCTQNPLELFVTVFYAVFCPVTGQLTYANAGHNPPYLRSADGRVKPLDAVSDLVLGMSPDTFQQHTEQLAPGDLLILYTDGVTEAFNTAGQPYGDERLLELLMLQEKTHPEQCVEAVFSSVNEFSAGAPQADDITVAMMAWQPAP